MSLTNNWQPFYELNNVEFNSYIHSIFGNKEYFSVDYLNNVVFKQFNVIYDRYNSDLNPDLNFSSFSDWAEKDCKYYFTDTIKNTVINGNNSNAVNSRKLFSLLSMNINSIPKNLEYFVDTCLNCLNFEFDILSFSETKLSDDIDQLYTINNYNKYSNNNTRKSGGVATFVKKMLIKCFEKK